MEKQFNMHGTTTCIVPMHFVQFSVLLTNIISKKINIKLLDSQGITVTINKRITQHKSNKNS